MTSTHPQKASSPVFNRSLLHYSIIAIFLGLASTVYALDYGDVTATLDRTDKSQLILSVRFSSVVPADKAALGITSGDAGQVQQAFANNLDICIAIDATQTACGATDTKVKYASGRTLPQEGNFISQTQLAAFIANGTVITDDPKDPTISSYRFDLLITDNSVPFAVDQKVFLRLFPQKTSSEIKDKNDISIVLGSGVRDAVEPLGAFSTPVSLIASWISKPTVTFVNATTGSPTGVIALLLPNADTPGTYFLAKTYVNDPTQEDPTPVTCNITADAVGLSCSVDCGTSTEQLKTFDPEATQPSGVRVQQAADAGATSLGFTDVSIEDGPYAIVLQYLPEGTEFSCVLGTPSDAATLVQLSGGPTPTAGDPTCFIATAAYGSALDPHIDVLRWFRDTYLLPFQWGRDAVRFYYTNSPPIARWIGEHSWARTGTRAVLWAPVLILKSWRDHAALSLTLFLFMTLAGFHLLRHQRAGSAKVHYEKP